MKLSFSTNAFVRYSLLEAVEKIANVGYQGVEILADSPHLFALSVNDSDISQLRRAIEKTGLHVTNVNANTAVGYYGRAFWEPLFEPSISNPDIVARKWRIDYTKKCIDLARTIGSPSVSITSGRPIPGIAPEKSRGLLKDSLQNILEYAEKQRVRLGIEYEPGLLLECYEELRAFLKEMDSPYLGANLDLGHSHVLGEDPKQVITGLAEKIFHVHLEDIRDRKHYHLIPGDGDMDFQLLLQILGTVNYNGFVTVELYTYPHAPEEAAKRALDYLAPLIETS